jgi:hypothetical protein
MEFLRFLRFLHKNNETFGELKFLINLTRKQSFLNFHFDPSLSHKNSLNQVKMVIMKVSKNNFFINDS